MLTADLGDPAAPVTPLDPRRGIVVAGHTLDWLLALAQLQRRRQRHERTPGLDLGTPVQDNVPAAVACPRGSVQLMPFVALLTAHGTTTALPDVAGSPPGAAETAGAVAPGVRLAGRHPTQPAAAPLPGVEAQPTPERSSRPFQGLEHAWPLGASTDRRPTLLVQSGPADGALALPLSIQRGSLVDHRLWFSAILNRAIGWPCEASVSIVGAKRSRKAEAPALNRLEPSGLV